MKRQTMLKAPGAGDSDDGSPADGSAESTLQREIAQLGQWLVAQGLDLQGEHVHADEGTRDRLYLRYGYFMGLKQALSMLTNRGATVH